MKFVEKVLFGLVAFSLTFIVIASQVYANETSKDYLELEDLELLELQKESARIADEVNKIYSSHAKKIGDMKLAALEKSQVNSLADLDLRTQETIEKAEQEITADMKEAIEDVMSKYGYENQLVDEEPGNSLKYFR